MAIGKNQSEVESAISIHNMKLFNRLALKHDLLTAELAGAKDSHDRYNEYSEAEARLALMVDVLEEVEEFFHADKIDRSLGN